MGQRRPNNKVDALGGWNIRFEALLSSAQMLLFPFSIMVLRRVIALVSSGLRLVMHAMAIGGQFCCIRNGYVVKAN